MDQWLNKFEIRIESEMEKTPGLERLVSIVFAAFVFFVVAFATQSLVSEELEHRAENLVSTLDQAHTERAFDPSVMNEVIQELENDSQLSFDDQVLLKKLKQLRQP